MALKIDYLANPVLFPVIATNRGFLAPNFRENLNVFVITEKESLTPRIISSLFPNFKLHIYYLDALPPADTPNVDIFINDLNLSELNQKTAKQILNLSKEILKKSGALYVKYEALPANGDKYFFIKFLNRIAETDDNQKLKEELDVFLKRPTRFLMQNSHLRQEIINWDINPNYSPYFFYEINDDLEGKGFKFAGRARVELNDPEVSLYPSHIPTVLRYKDDASRRETTVDVILNIDRHEDVYIKEPRENFEEALRYVCENYFLLPRQEPRYLRRLIALPGGHRLALTSPIYDYFFNQGENPVRPCSHPMFKGNESAVWKAFYKVLASGEFFLCVNDDLIPLERIKPELPERFSLSSLNRFLLEKALENLSDVYLYSDVTKAPSVNLNPIEVVLLWFAYKEGKSKAVEKTYEYLKSSDRTLSLGGERKSAKDVTEEELKDFSIRFFRGRKAFNLQRLKIVEEEP